MLSGPATREATRRFAHAFDMAPGFYRRAQEWTVSSLGLGSYLGPMDDATDGGYRAAVERAAASGINFFDTSLNYRHQRSERAIGQALRSLDRAAMVVCTKAGFLVPDAIPANLRQEDVAGGMHCLAPAFLRDQLERSRANLGVDCLDVFYLHNPETQLKHVAPAVFRDRIRAAFAALEELAAEGKLRYYGTATWDGYRTGASGLSLPAMAEAALEAGGDQHRFRFIQLPVNLAMLEGFTGGVLGQAAELGITAVASASLLQARLARNLPEQLAPLFPGLSTDAQRALQFTRSTPGVTVALVGMSQAAHVDENLAVSRVAPLTEDEYLTLFRK